MSENIKILNRFNLGSGVISLNKVKNRTNAITQDYKVCVIDLELMTITKQSQLINSKNLPHKYAKSASSSNSFACVCEVDSKVATIATVENQIQAKYKLKTHKADISSSIFSPDSTLFATGGEDGRVFLYESKDFRKFLSLPYRPDYISSLNFSKDSRFLIASCFNKSNIIFDCQRAKVISIFNSVEVVEWGNFFDNNSKLFLIMRNMQSQIYDLKENKITNIQNNFNDWPSIFDIDESSEIAVVGSRGSSIYLIHLKDNSKIFSLKLENIAGISSLCIHFGYIIVGSVSGEILIISYKDEDDRFKKACESKDYKLASELLDKNIFLSLQECAKVFDEDWEGILKIAIELLADNKIDEAIELTSPFTRDISKKNAFSVYLNKSNILKKFRELIDNKFYEEAYNMALQNKILTKSAYFDKLESIWNKAFSASKKILEENGNVDNAKRLLEPFMKTPKKEAIMQLLNNLHIFKDADNYIKEQNFKEYFSLTFKFSYLKDTELYKKVLNLGENLFEKALNAKNDKDYDEFFKLSKFLQAFPMYKDSIATNTIYVSNLLEFQKLYRGNRIMEAYKIALENDELQYLDEFKNLIKDFELVSEKAKEEAFNGKVELVSEIFGEYKKINYWSDRIKSIFQIAYLEEFRINFLSNKSAINWEHSIKNYIQIFGKSDEIVEFCEENGMSPILESLQNDFIKQDFSFQKTLLSKAI
ncbi:MAG: hypothetical protein K2P17_01605 [Helicobacteraceae bacterium]|nr:hypothetical protein [Helicobacteraceae bacterium]